PYLFKGPRPTITQTPDHLQYGAQFTVDTPDASHIAKVALIRTGSVTHGLNMDQRYQELTFHQNGSQLVIDAPANNNLAPPGIYYVFLISDQGVPSVAPMLPLTNSVDTIAPTAPTGVTATGAIGKVTLNWTASTDNVGVTKYEVHRSTTSGFTPSGATKVATVTSGTSWVDDNRPAGTYYYRVIALDAVGNASAPSAQVAGTALADTTPPTVTVSAPATASGTITVTATASDNVGVTGVQFKIDGANLGAPDTSSPYSASWDTTTATAGTHQVTAVAGDASGNTTTSSPVTVTVDNSAPPAPTPVAAYSFEETSGTTVTDATGRGHTGTITGATRTTTGKNGRALSFNGTSNYVSIPDANDLDLTTGMTLEAWVNPTNNTGWRSALIKERSGDLSYALYAGGDTTPLATITTTGASGYGEAGGPAGSAPPNNTWTHLAGTYDGTTLKLYRNGTLISSSTRVGSITVGTGPLKLGGNAIWGEWFAGQLDDVRVYNTALTAAQIQTDMNTAVGSTPPPPDTTAPSVPTGLAATGAIGKVTLNWTASTDNVGVTGYGVYRDGTRIATAPTTTYVDSGRPAGTYAYTVRAEDAAGNASAQTAPVNGTALADTTPPAVTVAAPPTASGTVSVTATASDDVGVTGVQFKLDGANLGAEDTTAPYSVSWDTTAGAAGPHTLTAVARDAAGNST
ncbi:MAG TPA: LamG-like jellyroll fold domain-containing protein, partial [Solirubrobacter sp.]